MAYTNNNSQTRVGVRIVPLSVVIPTTSALLDSYSGASAAYSLRKLKSSYTGSAIRVRRSSDNTEQNIGFDSNGNLDTYALSSFVGSGSGFVTTWYDQSGNGNNAAQTTSSYQPQIVSNGSILTTNGKPSIKLDGVDDEFVLNSSISSNVSTYQSFVGKRESSGDRLYALSNNAGTGYIFGLWNDNNYYLQAKSGFYQSSNSTDTTTSQLLLTGKVSSGIMSIFKNGNTIPSTQSTATISPFINSIGKYLNSLYPTKCSLQEIVFYNNDQTSNQTGIESNINTYYSVYPNPTSVWNLLNAVYSADTTASSSLKTSLFAAYNGESNANDSFGTNNGTAVGGLTYSTGKIGNAFQFNGTNAYVSLANNSFNLTGDFSISLWVFFTSLNSEQVPFSNYYESAPSAGNTRGFMIYISGQTLYWAICGSSQVLLTTNISSFLNTWKQITITFKSGVGSKIYFDGSLVTSNSSTVTPIYNSTQSPFIGRYQYGNGSLEGLMKNGSKVDALNIWQKELTASEVSELYNSGNGAQYIGDNFYKPTTNDALNTYNGTAQGGLTYGLGKVGTAFQFNGTNALVSLPTNSMKFTGDFSYSFWVNLASLGGYPTLISNYINAGGDYGYIIRMNPSGKLEFWGFATSTNSFAMASLTTFNTNTWYHVSVTKSASSVKIYVNGVLNITNSVGVPITYFSTMYPSIGALYKWNGSLSADFVSNGSKIDAVGIWNKELTQAEVTELYNSGNGKQYPN